MLPDRHARAFESHAAAAEIGKAAGQFLRESVAVANDLKTRSLVSGLKLIARIGRQEHLTGSDDQHPGGFVKLTVFGTVAAQVAAVGFDGDQEGVEAERLHGRAQPSDALRIKQFGCHGILIDFR